MVPTGTESTWELIQGLRPNQGRAVRDDPPEDTGAECTLVRNAAPSLAGRQLHVFIYPALAHDSFVLGSRIPSDRENLGTFSDISVWFDRTLVETFKFPSGITLVTQVSMRPTG